MKPQQDLQTFSSVGSTIAGGKKAYDYLNKPKPDPKTVTTTPLSNAPVGTAAVAPPVTVPYAPPAAPAPSYGAGKIGPPTAADAGYSATTSGGTGFAASAGNWLKSGAGIGTIAAVGGDLLQSTKWGDDQDPTTYKFGEATADVLSYGGRGAAYGSYFGPVGTAVGAVIGTGYGLITGFSRRKQARKKQKQLEKDHETRMEELKDKRHGIINRMRTVSGVDTGRALRRTR